MSFLYPSILFALAAVSIPVIIHLFDLQRPKKVFFTNVSLLKNVNEQTTSARKIKHLLVLICRILFIIFLVLAFAQPFIKRDNSELFIGSQGVGIYLDNSLSMQNEDGQKSLLDRSVKTVEKITEVFPPASQYFFLDNNFSPKDRIALSGEKFKDRITEITYSNISRSFDNIYKRQVNAFSDFSRKEGKKLFWFSDFQKSTAGDLTKIPIDTTVRLYLVPLQNKKASNIYIDSVWLDNFFIRENENNSLKVKLKNSGEKQVENLHLKLIIDEVQSGASSIEIAPNSSSIASFDFNVKDKNLKKCKIVFEDEPVNFDNQYFFIIQVSPTINILNISDGKQNFISSLYSNEEAFHFKENKFGNISNNLLEKANLVIVDGFDALNNAEITSLKSFIQKGGNLLILPTDKPNMQTLNENAGILKLPLFQSLVTETNNKETLNQVQFPDLKNPFFENVFEKIDKNVDMPLAYPVISWGNRGQKLLLTRKEQPFLSLFKFEKSNVYVCSTPLKEPFTTFHKHSVFVPVMYKIAINSVTENRTLAYTFNDKNVVISINSVNSDKKYSLKRDDFNYIPDQSLRAGKLIVDIPNVTMEAGFYDLMLNDSIQKTIAINPAKFESAMAFYSKDELKSTFGRYNNITIFENEITDSFITDFKAKHVGLSLWKYCLITALLFLLAEVLLIRFMK